MVTDTCHPVVARFTRDGEDLLERHLDLACARVASGIRGLIPERKLEAVLLGGGYGRGEGGVWRDPAGDRPYNDLEFYVAVKGSRLVNEALYGRRLEILGDILSHLADADVDFKITSLAEFRFGPVSMFSYDLAAGHRLVFGAAGAEVEHSLVRHRCAWDIPPAEATRLLMNRCTGLLFARERLGREPFAADDAEFASRNIAKAQLACGDALLAAEGLYHWSCRERHARLRALARHEPSPSWMSEIVRHHADGVEFKLHPPFGAETRETLAARHRELTRLTGECWLRLESRRLGRPFGSAREYASDPCDKCPGAFPLRNLLLNLRLGDAAIRSRAPLRRHPRQRAFHLIALLLWEPDVFKDPSLRRILHDEMGARPESLAEAIPLYRRFWQKVR